jgi:Methionine synthase I (cobalamin-dependent), methyltransferase domain
MNGKELREFVVGDALLCDGGMGTALIAAGAPVGACLEALNIDDPADVALVHRSFLEAGARLILTNTFGANRFRLGSHGIDRKSVA